MNEKRLKKHRSFLKLEEEAVTISTALLEEFVFEGELYIIPEYELKMVEEYLRSIHLFNGIIYIWKRCGRLA